MSDKFEPAVEEEAKVEPLSNLRILILMASVGVAASVITAFAVSFRFGSGVLIGTALAFLNYAWLHRSLNSVFAAARQGQKPRVFVGSYFLRYLFLGFAVAAIYILRVVPVSSLILGMAAFGFAVVAEGSIRLFSSIFSSR